MEIATFVFPLVLCRNVYVVVVPLRRAKGAIKHLKSPDEMDLEEVGSAWSPFTLHREIRKGHESSGSVGDLL